ncbi:C40 family peptidase [Paenibacillus piri]|uniref:NlpC/P60 family protein n=1 Tax=Paenibacillus piri TaxID=2547395 RepID=A0A4R5KQE7_9BACL|nr:NlpC/P60 family protein [Paenibacillus piri]
MNNAKKSQFVKTFVGIGLSLSIAFSGGMLITPQSAHAATVSSSSVADNVIATGKQFMGVRYQFGASKGNTSAFDCSSFTQYVFQQNGISLPRSSRQQATAGTPVAKSQLQAGDLVFSDTNHDGIINHVAIYMGNGQILHTYRVGIGVTISNYAGSTWDKTFVTARRVIPDNGQAVAAPAPQPVSTPSKSPSVKPYKTTSSKPSKSSKSSSSKPHGTHAKAKSSKGENERGEH